MKKIAQGAEAKLYLTDSKIIKYRFKKEYRIKEIDSRLRKSRTKREAKIFDKLSAIGFPAPKLIESDGKEKISMEFIKGPKVRDILEKSPGSPKLKKFWMKRGNIRSSNRLTVR